MAARRTRRLSVGVAGAVLAGLLSTVGVVSPQQATAAASSDDGTPVVPAQSVGTVPAQQAEEAGTVLPAPKWPKAAEATVDLSQAAPGDPGTVTASPSVSASGGTTEVADVVEVAPVNEGSGTSAQLSRARLTEDDTASPQPTASDGSSPQPDGADSLATDPAATDSAEATASASADPDPDASRSPQPSDSASAPPADDGDPVSPNQVEVRVLDHDDVAPAGGVGMGVQVLRTDGVASPGQVQVSIDYSGFQYAYGGDFADRLRLVKVPACALQTPDAAECQQRESVPVDNDTAKGTLTATVEAEPDSDGLSTQLAAGSASVYAVTTGSSSDQGDYRASTLSPTGSWDVSTGSGAFTYNLPVSLPAPAHGKAPSLAMSYNSQSVDGRTSATNNQASWVGMGWDLNVGYIERRYRNCTEDGLKTIGDMCWDSPNSSKEPDGAVYVISFNGVTSQLIQDNTGTGSYHVQDDPGWRVQHITSGGYGADDEYWVISTQDGSRYYFGWGRNERTQGSTGSVFTEPVVGNDAGEPCHAQFPEPCTQAWRWNLDRSVDPNEVETAYYYDKQTNYYRSVANTDKARSYTASGYLTRIEYGWASQISGSKPTGKVELSHVKRCVERMAETDPLRDEPAACPSISSSPTSYPDVPLDLLCDGTAADYYCAGKTYYPTFFSTDMLWDIKTFVLNTTADGWDLVQQYQTKHGLPNPSGTIGKTLWLDYVQREAYGTGANKVLPVINFNGIDLDNQVGSSELNFRRVNTIHGDLGATTTVTYDAPDPCTIDNLPSESSNTKDCFWQKWTPEGGSEKTGWFKKFLVTKVTVDPTVTSSQDGAPEMTTSYTYDGGAGWRFTNDPLTKDDDESWSDWRGYHTVEVTTGSGAVKHTTVSWLYRGLDGDRTSKSDASKTRSVSVADGEGTSYTDSAWLQGQTIETSSRDDAGSSHQHVFHHYWTYDTAQYIGLPDARFVREDQTTTQTKISTGWRTHVVQNEYDASTSTSTVYGLPLRTDDQGEQGVSDNQCTTYGRAYNTDYFDGSKVQRWMILPDETRHYDTGGGSCADRDASNQDAYSYTLYDNAASVSANHPADGNATATGTYTTAGDSDPQRATFGYDAAGRQIWSQDADLNRTTTTYNPSSNWPLNGIITTTPDPDGSQSTRGPLTSTVWNSRFWGVPYQTKNANGDITKITLDAAGRVTEVWEPTETGANPSLKYEYSIPTTTSGGVPDSAVGYPMTTTSTLQSGSTYVTSYAYADGLGRARETQANLPSESPTKPYRQVAVTRYDSAGNATGTSAVFRSTGIAGGPDPVSPKVEDLPSYTELTLDWAGRTTMSQILVGDGTSTRAIPEGQTWTAYYGDYTSVTTRASGATDTYTNIFGQPSQVVEHNGSSTFTTKYTYDDKGQLQQISDPRGNNTYYTYDWAGNRKEADDPDSGVTKTTYDHNGRVSSVGNKINPVTKWPTNTLTYGYDTLGRQTSVSQGTTTLASWQWDGLGVSGGKGQITSATSTDANGNTYTVKTGAFDSRGRPLSTTVTLPAAVNGLAGDYTTSYHYDAADHITAVDYPAAGGLAAETVNTTYNDYGQPTSLASSTQTYVKNTAYNAYDQLTDRYYGNPTVGTNTVTAQRHYDYDQTDGTRQLTGITTTTTVDQSTTQQRQQDTYTYDNDGRITEIREQATGQTAQSQCFTYDDQGRLNNADTRSLLKCQAPGTNSDFLGEAPYQTAYAYDRLGNLQSVTDTHSTGEAVSRDYLYPGYDDTGTWTTANAPQLHGVRKINIKTGSTTTGTEDFTYDTAGQMLKHIEPSKTSDYTWTPQGQLATATTTDPTGSKLTRYTYAADGNLLTRTTPQETIAYLGGMELHTDGTKTTATRYYTCGGATVAMRTTTGTSSGNTLTYLMADNQASTQLTVNAATGTTTRRRYTPFGDERSGTLPTGTSNGFLGKTEDTTTGLSLLGARAYDPHLARFLSPDPLVTPYNPQNLSAYSYTNNNPINYTDPSGLGAVNSDGVMCGTGAQCDDFAKNHPDVGSTPSQSDSDTSWQNTVTPASTDARTLGQQFYEFGVNKLAASTEGGYWYPKTHSSGESDIVCFGRTACNAAYAYILRHPGDIAGAKHIAATYCLDHMAKCQTDARVWDRSQGIGTEFVQALGLGDGSALRIGSTEAAAGMCSFSPDTPVLMDGGKTKPIGKIRPGDKVEAADQKTGRHVGAREVQQVWINHDTDLLDLVIRTKDGHTATLHTTASHPFWDDTQGHWIPAGRLHNGDALQTATTTHAQVVTTRPTPGTANRWNLTVQQLHTYYVLAGETPVLVHNATCSRNEKGQFTSGENADAARGRLTHLNYRNALGAGYDFEVRLPSGLRPDAVDWNNRVVRELKSDAPSSMATGRRQLQKYVAELEEITGQSWTGHLDIYKRFD
ncbi:RHS repeat-associated core domain-containing protein [Streptomyces sp. NPDC048291]|uniref:RHS repeat-associated core domain-containing protein n=1 Tax=Streptomyces sp. NPDC048291 TaxID=3365530 RepID=UPI0037180541